jgi:hypothetical protein
MVATSTLLFSGPRAARTRRLRGLIVQNEANVKLENPDLAGGCVAAPGFVIHVTKCGALQRFAAQCSASQRPAAPAERRKNEPNRRKGGRMHEGPGAR